MSRNLPDEGRGLYPTPHTGAPLRGVDKKDFMGVKGNESRLVRCRFCGFICDTERDMQMKDGNFAGRGVSHGSQKTSSSYKIGNKSVTEYYYEPDVTGGCPCCGSYLYAG